MKKTISILFACLLAISAASAQQAEFVAKLDDFLGEVNTALPDSAVIGGTWSDAYIGQLLAVPPHFGVGVAVGATRFPVKALSDAVAMSGASLPASELVLPNFAVEGRVGGLIIPFDLGVRFGMMPTYTLSDVSVDYLHYAADIRLPVMKEGLVTPDLSIGAGYYHTQGNVGYTFNAGELANIDPSYGTFEEKLKVAFSTDVFEAKAQVSKSLVIFTPTAGIAAYLANTKSSYDVATEKNDASKTAYGVRAFGGLAFNVFLLKLDLTGSYNFLNQNWGANFGARVQL